MISTYRPLPGAFDELRAPDGSVRDHWAFVTKALTSLGPAELDHRRRETERLLRNDGATYTVYDDPGGQNAPWILDPIPLVISAEEWAVIDRGIVQRAELFNLILSDLYGPRELVRKGLLPLEVVYGHRGFLRQCDQIRLPGSQQLVSYAADLARDPDGRLVVLGDFAQAPSGAGYALENRNVVSRVFSNIYRDTQVHRLAPFFRALRASLSSLAPAGVDDPRVVVLTPGPLNETYFEHAYLARYLGYSLVEGPDLTVQAGRVWLRSLGGLEPVDVILRRVDGWYGDPLELKPNSQLGVPGLVEAARRGTVSVVNGFGASVLENPGLLPFLPRISQFLLGQDLQMPSVTTWWCGHPSERDFVLSQLDELIVKPIGRRSARASANGWELSPTQRAELTARIEAKPYLYVAQPRVAYSSVPCLDGAGIGARHAMFRAFTVARDGSYVAMPGGLTRVSASPDDQFVSAQLGGASKDTWVLASEPERPSGLGLHTGSGVAVIDAAGSMPSRAAENLFWLGRYAERAEGSVRLARATLETTSVDCIDSLLYALTGSPKRFIDRQAELLSIVADANRPNSLTSSLIAMLSAANAVRDQLSNDTWLALGPVEQDLASLHKAFSDPHADGAEILQSVLASVIRSLLALAGLATESMVRDPGWRFMDAGRRIERGIQLTNLIGAMVVPTPSSVTNNLLLESLLISAESIITYRRRYRSQASVNTVLELLLLDVTNPRSLSFQLDRLKADIAELPRPPQPRLTEEERLVLELSTRLRVADIEALAEIPRNELAAFLKATAAQLAETSIAIDHAHFTHLAPRHTLVAGQPDAMGDTLGTAMP